MTTNHDICDSLKTALSVSQPRNSKETERIFHRIGDLLSRWMASQLKLIFHFSQQASRFTEFSWANILKQFGNNDELTDEQVMIRKNMGIIHDPA